jgi:hypothetical protein
MACETLLFISTAAEKTQKGKKMYSISRALLIKYQDMTGYGHKCVIYLSLQSLSKNLRCNEYLTSHARETYVRLHVVRTLVLSDLSQA